VKYILKVYNLLNRNKIEMAQHSRDELLYLARLAEQCDRFDGKSLA
jgi:hypothetical protein